MKRFLCLFFFFACFMTCQAEGHYEALFSSDEELVTAELAELTELENFVSQQQGISLVELEAHQTSFSASFLQDIAASYAEPPLGIPSFLWGCVFGVAGMAVVYFISEDKEETKKALYGCIASSVITGAVYVAYVAIFISMQPTI